MAEIPEAVVTITINGRCATCRWAEQDEFVRGMALDDERKRFPLFCKRADSRDGYPEDPQTLAFSMDGSTYGATLLVSPDFGCVMWEAADG